ncbi:hypothetical protein D3C86_1248520 [compost metagenome]
MLLGIQYIMWNFTLLHHTAQQLRNFYRSSTYQYRTADSTQCFYFVDYGFILFTLGFINQILLIFTLNRTVGRNIYHIQFVDFPELTCFCFGSTGHTT